MGARPILWRARRLTRHHCNQPNKPTKANQMKTIAALILFALLTACGGGEEDPADVVANDPPPSQQAPKPNCAANPEVCK